MSEVRACVFCKNCEWEEPYSYSTLTQGGGYFSCLASQFVVKDTKEMLEGWIYKKAQECPDFCLKDELRGNNNG